MFNSMKYCTFFDFCPGTVPGLFFLKSWDCSGTLKLSFNALTFLVIRKRLARKLSPSSSTFSTSKKKPTKKSQTRETKKSTAKNPAKKSSVTLKPASRKKEASKKKSTGKNKKSKNSVPPDSDEEGSNIHSLTYLHPGLSDEDVEEEENSEEAEEEDEDEDIEDKLDDDSSSSPEEVKKLVKKAPFSRRDLPSRRAAPSREQKQAAVVKPKLVIAVPPKPAEKQKQEPEHGSKMILISNF